VVVREDELFMQGVELMLFGVSAVVIFLSLLVLAIGLASQVILRFFPQPAESQAVAQRRTSAAPAESSLDAERIAVITAAVHQHRQRGRNG
jgi:oxaloacetate decarboxylase gamma subunit